jgi:hypothetical protein
MQGKFEWTIVWWLRLAGFFRPWGSDQQSCCLVDGWLHLQSWVNWQRVRSRSVNVLSRLLTIRGVLGLGAWGPLGLGSQCLAAFCRLTFHVSRPGRIAGSIAEKLGGREHKGFVCLSTGSKHHLQCC